MATNEAQLHLEHARIEASSGALCRGEACCGWHPTQLDVWVPCSCNPGGCQKEHPEVSDPGQSDV
jgi:hypothetical protein